MIFEDKNINPHWENVNSGDKSVYKCFFEQFRLLTEWKTFNNFTRESG